ncbi:hypothetical protein F4861DRAFT_539419 [Xylaria intraflava]|nr:hypothetical protein F4861DRAFT_539419 [Xylaria intraflava]
MKYLALLTPFLLGATAAPVTQDTNTVGSIRHFRASTNPNSSGASISYLVEITDQVRTYCYYSDETSGPKLPNVGQIYCDNPDVKWQFNQDPSPPHTEGRYRIVVIYTSPESPHVVTAGFHEWDPSDFSLQGDGASVGTVYQGAPNFVLDNA